MVAKIIVHGHDRKEAIEKMRSALGEVVIDGIKTNLDMQYEIINSNEFAKGNALETTDVWRIEAKNHCNE